MTDTSVLPDSFPKIVYWMDRPLSELPREELEAEFCKAHQEIERLHDQIAERSIAHVRDLSRIAQRRLHERTSLMGRIFR